MPDEIVAEAAGIEWIPNRLTRRLNWAAGAALTVAALGGIGIWSWTSVGVWAFLGGILGAFGMFVAGLLVPLLRRARPGLLRVANGVLEVSRGSRTRSIPRGALATGWMLSIGGSQVLELTLRDGDAVRAQVRDGEGVLTALGLDGAQKTARFEMRSMIGKMVRGLLVLCAANMLAMCAWPVVGDVFHLDGLRITFAWIGFLAMTFAMTQRWRTMPTLVIGSDGIAVERAGGRTFIGYEQIESVIAQHPQYMPNGVGVPGSVVVKLRNGRSRTFPAVGFSREKLDALVFRAREASERRASGGGVDILRAKLARSGRDVATWRRELAHVLDAGVGYREHNTTVDDVARVLTDAAAPTDVRIGAAIALRNDTQQRERVRVAAATCADVKVRVALERAAQGEIDEEVAIESARARAQG